uniref:CIDE-N domain-containing protein n=1 Tax=Oreochromis aureus TaxID=47969 RepID=A0A668S8K5_OREAU
ACKHYHHNRTRVFMMSYQFLTLVLEEDGTVVDSEEFFQSLPNSTPLMVLEKGEMWTESKVRPKKSGIAKVTFDLYKLQPKDFLCCLAIRATLYETYTLSYDFRFTRIKHILKRTVSVSTSSTSGCGGLDYLRLD